MLPLVSVLAAVAGCGGETGPAGTSSTGTGGGSGGGPNGCAAVELSPSLVTAGTWDPGFTVPGFTGEDGLGPVAYDLARDPSGAVVAVGRFSYIDGAPVFPIARLTGGAWKGDAAAPFSTTQPGISAVAIDDQGRVAVATYSTLPLDVDQRDGEIWVDDGGGFQNAGAFHGAVRSMAWYGGELWVGGLYTLDSGEGGPGLSVLGSAGWHAPPGGPMVGTGVYELTLDGTSLLVGGAFTGIGGIAAQSVASWDGAAWTAFDLGQQGNVFALARSDQGELYAGGLFSVEGSVETGGIARWTGSAWASVGGGLANTSFRGVVSDLVFHKGALHVAGCFSFAGGTPADPSAVPARGFALWTGTGWEALDDGKDPVASGWFSPGSCGDEGPAAIWDAQQQRLLSDGERLYAAGFFPGVGGVPSQSIIAYENGAWLAQGKPANGLSGAARVVTAGGPDCALHAMGGFSHAGALATHGAVVRYDEGTGWSRVGPDLPPNTYCWGMSVDGAGVPFLGCDLTENDTDPPVGVVYALTGGAWKQVGGSFAEGGVAVLGHDATGTLWVAGGGAQGFVARAQDDGFTTLGSFDGRVGSIAFETAPGAGEAPRVVVGGAFTSVDGQPARGVARWNGSSWEALGPGLAGSVLAVAYAADGSVYASTADDSTPDRLILGRWDGASWQEVAAPEPGPTPAGYAFSALLARGEHVIAAGFAWPNSGERNVYVYDGKSFTSLRGGATAISVDTLALSASGLWLGGSLAEVGPPGSRIPSIGIARLH